MARRAKIGDVCEIKTPAGLAYVQYTHDAGNMGQLVRVLPGLYDCRPDVKKLGEATELYFIYYTLNYALRDRLAEVISNERVPEWAVPFPIMRRQARDGWLIGDGSKMSTLEDVRKLTYVRELTPDQKKLSIGEVLYPHPALVKELARGWTPERDEEFLQNDIAAREAREKAEAASPQEPEAQSLDHYLYFPKKSQAITAGERLKTKGWTIEVKKGGDEESWLTLAKQPAPIEDDIEEIRDELESLAEELGGEYDGWGSAV